MALPRAILLCMTPDLDKVLKRFQDRWNVADMDYDLSAGFQVLGDTSAVPRVGHLRLTSADGKSPDVEIDFAVDTSTRWRCTKLVVVHDDVSSAMLESLQLADLVTFAMGHFSFPIDPQTGRVTLAPHPDRAGVAKAAARRRSRTRITKDELKEVAEAYKAAVLAGSAQPTQDVADKLGFAHGTAAKRVMRAREEGLLPPTTKGKVQA
jgi:hypothetical protein